MFKLKKARAQVYKLAPLLNASLQFSMLLVLWFSLSFAQVTRFSTATLFVHFAQVAAGLPAALFLGRCATASSLSHGEGGSSFEILKKIASCSSKKAKFHSCEQAVMIRRTS